MAVALYGGVAAGLIACALTCFIVVYFWYLIVLTPFIVSSADWLSLCVFVFTCTMISIITESMRQSKERAKENVKYLINIIKSGEHLLSLINDILDLSKIEAGKLEIEKYPFNLEEVLQNTVNQISAKSQEKGLELLVSIEDNVPIRLSGDSLRLGQVLSNLASNAVKFTAAGEVIIRVKLLENGGTSALLQFSVKDTGIGLTEDQMKNLFQPFTQAETSTTRKYGGTGLGLAISKKLVDLLDGDIWVESEVGKGSTFFFTARFTVAGQEKFSLYKNAFTAWGLTILVVDDHEHSRDIIGNMLTDMSYDVTKSSSGEEAIAILEKTKDENRYGLAIMDWRMPGIDGIEAAEVIQAKICLT